jgi:hypothetical protein
MRFSKLKSLGGIIALMLVICCPSFGGPLTIFDNLAAPSGGTLGTFNGGLELAQRFTVTDTNTIDYVWSSNLSGFEPAWLTIYGFAFQMQVVVDQDTNTLTSATLSMFNDVNGDEDFPAVRICSDFPDLLSPFGPQSEPGGCLGTLTTAVTPFPMGTLTNVTFTPLPTSSINLVPGFSYWVVLSSPGPLLDADGDPTSLGVDTQWSLTDAPEPASLALVGGALALLLARRKRH